MIASSVGGLQEVVHDGLNGTLAAPENAASLADAIERCAADLNAMAARACDDAPSWAEVADAVLKASGVSR
jgi:glycosyltransferase involved in cell wall biosynthesis